MRFGTHLVRAVESDDTRRTVSILRPLLETSTGRQSIFAPTVQALNANLHILKSLLSIVSGIRGWGGRWNG